MVLVIQALLRFNKAFPLGVKEIVEIRGENMTPECQQPVSSRSRCLEWGVKGVVSSTLCRLCLSTRQCRFDTTLSFCSEEVWGRDGTPLPTWDVWDRSSEFNDRERKRVILPICFRWSVLITYLLYFIQYIVPVLIMVYTLILTEIILQVPSPNVYHLSGF